MADYSSDQSFARIDNDYMYHPPTEEKIQIHQEVRTTLRSTAKYFDELLPNGREKALVLTKLEEAMFWANAAIARHS